MNRFGSNASRPGCAPRAFRRGFRGSRARGEADALSDVDIAVLAAERPDRTEADRLQNEWMESAVRILGTE